MNNLIQSTEYRQSWGQLDNTAFVAQITAEVFGTAFQGGELEYWANQLQSEALTRTEALIRCVGIQSYQDSLFADNMLIS